MGAKMTEMVKEGTKGEFASDCKNIVILCTPVSSDHKKSFSQNVAWDRSISESIALTGIYLVLFSYLTYTGACRPQIKSWQVR